MAKKYCPRCNSNQRLAMGLGKRCCSRCGLDADYMSPAISNDNGSFRPESQYDTQKVPEREGSPGVSEGTDSPEDDYSTGRFCKILCIIFILGNLLILFVYMAGTKTSWNLEDGTTVVCTVLDRYRMMGYGEIVRGLVIAALIIAFFRPSLLILVCPVAILLCGIPGWPSITFQFGLPLILVSIFVNITACGWMWLVYPNGIRWGFFLGFWFNIRMKGHVLDKF